VMLCRWCGVHVVLCTCYTFGTGIHVVLCACHTCCVVAIWYYVCPLCSRGIVNVYLLCCTMCMYIYCVVHQV